MTATTLSEPRRGVKPQKSMDLNDVFGSQYFGGKSFDKTGTADGARSVAFPEESDGDETDTGRSVASTRSSRHRNGRKSHSRRRALDPNQHKSVDLGASANLINLLAGKKPEDDDDDEEELVPTDILPKQCQQEIKPKGGGRKKITPARSFHCGTGAGERPKARGGDREHNKERGSSSHAAQSERNLRYRHRDGGDHHTRTHHEGGDHHNVEIKKSSGVGSGEIKKSSGHGNERPSKQHRVPHTKSHSEAVDRHRKSDRDREHGEGERSSIKRDVQHKSGSRKPDNRTSASRTRSNSKEAKRKPPEKSRSRHSSSSHHQHHQRCEDKDDKPRHHPKKTEHRRTSLPPPSPTSPAQEGNENAKPKRPSLGARKTEPLRSSLPPPSPTSPAKEDREKTKTEPRRSSLPPPSPTSPAKEDRENAKPERPSLGVRAPSLRELADQPLREPSMHKKLSLIELSPRSLADEADASYLENSRHFTTDDESTNTEDQSDADTLLQFDPSQDSNVFRVHQVTNDHSNFKIDNADGTSMEGKIAEIVDPFGDAQQLHVKKEQPIFDFLDQDDEEDELDFGDPFAQKRAVPLNCPSGGEEETNNKTPLDCPSGGEDQGNDDDNSWLSPREASPRKVVAYPSGGEQDSESESDDARMQTIPPQFTNAFGGGGRLNFPSGGEDQAAERDDDEDSWFSDFSLPVNDGGALPSRRTSGAGNEDRQQPRRKVKRKVKKSPPHGDDGDAHGTDADKQRQRRKKQIEKNKTKKKKPARDHGDGDPDESNYDTDFSLDNVIDKSQITANLGLDGLIHAPLSPSKIVNNVYQSFQVVESEDADEVSDIEKDDDMDDRVDALETEDEESSEEEKDEEEDNKSRAPIPGEAPFTFAPPESGMSPSKRGIGLGLGSSIGRYFGRSRRGLGDGQDDDDRSVSSRSSIGSRLFGAKTKQHQLLGDDDSCDSGTNPF